MNPNQHQPFDWHHDSPMYSRSHLIFNPKQTGELELFDEQGDCIGDDEHNNRKQHLVSQIHPPFL